MGAIQVIANLTETLRRDLIQPNSLIGFPPNDLSCAVLTPLAAGLQLNWTNRELMSDRVALTHEVFLYSIAVHFLSTMLKYSYRRKIFRSSENRTRENAAPVMPSTADVYQVKNSLMCIF